MSTKKPSPRTVIAGVEREDDHLLVVYKWCMFRYLFDGGATVDVVAIQDDSDLRAWVLAVTGHPGIVGCTIVEGSDE